MCSNPKILANVLHSVVFLLTGHSYKMSNIYHCQPIRTRLLELVTFPDKSVRVLAAKALASLCCTSNKHFINNLLRQMGMLDCLYKYLTQFEQSQK
jgi:hypothetical protein